VTCLCTAVVGVFLLLVGGALTQSDLTYFFRLLKNRTWTRWNPKPKLGDPSLKKHWDPSKSAEANLASFGLVAQPNKLPNQTSSSNNAAGIDPSKAALIELFDVPDSDAPSRRDRFPLTEEEEEYIATCMAKHGDNYRRMFRDTKGVNKMQHTEEKLRKLGSRFLLLTSEQRRVEIPDKVKPLLPGASSTED